MTHYTSIEQSKHLLDFGFSPESADMYYHCLKETNAAISSVPFVKDETEVENSAYDALYYRIPCWSLAALLEVYPMIVGKDIGMYCCWQNHHSLCSRHYDNPVDACYEMILKLHKQNLL